MFIFLLHLVALLGAFELPARMSYYPLLITKAAMPSAVAMNSLTWQGTRVIAPAIAGVLIAVFGATPTLFVCCVGFLLMIVFLNMTRVDIPSNNNVEIHYRILLMD
ncbi:MAG: hypothetical protein CM1200mP33_7470 [Chloroflexota bacterium]|nr:MAG: hypothetical protein CM1200mP33_7470 [Chloroflexota bacterium]